MGTVIFAPRTFWSNGDIRMRGNISNEMLLVVHKVCQTKRPLGTPVKCVKRNVPLAQNVPLAHAYHCRKEDTNEIIYSY